MKKGVTVLNRVASFQVDNSSGQKDQYNRSYFCTCLFPFLPKFSSLRKDVIPRPSQTLLDLELDIIKPQNSF